MAELLNEQDQLDALKTFWRRCGRWLLLLIILVAVGMIGWQYWQGRQQAKVVVASSLYQTLLDDVSKQNNTAASADATLLMQHYAATPYASMAGLFLAALNVNKQDYATASQNLQWVIDHATTPAFKATASIRLARIMIAQGQAQQALALLKHAPEGYEGAYAAVQGDAYAALQQNAAAKDAYQVALSSLPPGDYMAGMVKMKLSNLPASAAS